MAFYEVQFPSSISFGAQGGPGYRTDVVVVSSGAETRNVTWAAATPAAPTSPVAAR